MYHELTSHKKDIHSNSIMPKLIILQSLSQSGQNLEQYPILVVPGNLSAQIAAFFRNHTSIRGRLAFIMFHPFHFDHVQNNQIIDIVLIGNNEILRNHVIEQHMNPAYFNFSQHIAIPASMPTITI